ncbi:AraC family transcriptional regulator [Actinomadura sp. KC06]|uniref:AraC family transcriptional regulator n=1 Tax=Actinomadura sp. KC06 TaxID=2530369 RepID=UPI0010530350|nr:AraC family ligand binding domain-containing protein [Actinomadura sp. KC06]TDD32727.1 AraC family transcriptional regulator [Actinomadura sp. KC06]
MELLQARYVQHEFARHAHETFAIGVIQAGSEEIWFQDGDERVGVGGLVFINPEVVHTGRSLSEGGWLYRVLYPAAGTLAKVGGMRGTPHFPDRLVDDARAAGLLLRAHAATESADALTAETLMRMTLSRLLLAHARVPGLRPGRPQNDGFVARARDVLHERMEDPPGLDELAAGVGVDPFTLLRAFRRAHLSRHFRRLVGVPPGVYQRAARTYKRSGPQPA